MPGVSHEPVVEHRGLASYLTTVIVLLVTLVWGCVLIYGVGYGGYDVCEQYTQANYGHTNHALDLWCNNKSYTSLLPLCLAGAGLTVIAAGIASYLWPRRTWIVVALTAVSLTLVWIGFALPQILAG